MNWLDLIGIPYGAYVEEDGSVVLHGRNYKPTWRRRPNGMIERADGWVKYVDQMWFYKDVQSPRHYRHVMLRCIHALHAFYTNQPLQRHARMIGSESYANAIREQTSPVQTRVPDAAKTEGRPRPRSPRKGTL